MSSFPDDSLVILTSSMCILFLLLLLEVDLVPLVPEAADEFAMGEKDPAFGPTKLPMLPLVLPPTLLLLLPALLLLLEGARHLDMPDGIPRAVRDRETDATTRRFRGRGNSRDGCCELAGMEEAALDDTVIGCWCEDGASAFPGLWDALSLLSATVLS